MTVGQHPPICKKCGAHYAADAFDKQGLCPECSPLGLVKPGPGKKAVRRGTGKADDDEGVGPGGEGSEKLGGKLEAKE